MFSRSTALALRPVRRFSNAGGATRASVLSSPPTSERAPEAPLRPQPFIPKPLSRIPQISTLKAATPTQTTISFSSPGLDELAVTVPNLFLRDSSTHPSHVHPASRQRLFRTTDIPRDGSLVGYGVHEVGGEDCLVTEWSTPVAGVPKGSEKLSVVPVKVLLGVLDGTKLANPADVPALSTWDKAALGPSLTTTPFPAYLSSDAALHSTLKSLLSTGIAFVSQVPTQDKKGHHTDLRKVVERIGTLRTTWYGDLWDVRAEEGSKNIAYTNLDLGLHMDLTHFAHPPRYQFLHSLQNTAIVGGSSYFVDTYHIASILRASHPEAYATLCSSPMTFEYHNGGHHTRWTRPTIELSPIDSSEIEAVNYSPPFQGPLLISPSADPDAVLQLHDALSLFATLADDPANQYHVQLEPGDCVIFDNRRVLHARTAFEFVDQDGATNGAAESGRWLKGAYMNGDEVASRWRVLEEKRVDKGELL